MTAIITKSMTLAALTAEYGSEWYVFADAGNGSGFGQDGQALRYDADAAAEYGNIVLHESPLKMGFDGIEYTSWASDWIDGSNGYRYQIRF